MMRAIADTKVETLLKEWNLRFDLIEAVPLDSIIHVPEQQARSVAHRALPENVESFYQHMKNGAQFPPMVLREPRILLDGNTREAAALKLGMQVFPCYVVHDIANDSMARALSGAINQLGGQRLSGDEAQELAVEMLYGELKLPVGEVARYVGRSATQITKWRRQTEVLNHAERLGIADQLKAISVNQRGKLADVQLDEPFRRLVEVIAGAKPPSGELTKVVREVESASSEADAIATIDAAAADWRPTGPSGRVVRNEKARRARMVVPQLLNLRAAELFEPDKADEDLRMWERLREQVEEVLRAFALRASQTPLFESGQ
jgi:transposase-like protein